MSSANSKSAYLRGLRAGAPFLLVVAPFALLFGVVATEAGLNLAQVMGFSVLVIAGASQFAALQLMTENAPIFIVLISALAVNLRMAMYAASLAPYLGPAPSWKRALIAYFNVDQTYALSVQEYESKPQLSVAERVAYFFGAASAICPVWYLVTYLGAVFGTTIPPSFALDFAVPITFLALIAPALRTIAHVVSAMASVALALIFAFLPYNLWILVAAMGAMLIGAEVERQVEKRKAKGA